METENSYGGGGGCAALGIAFVIVIALIWILAH